MQGGVGGLHTHSYTLIDIQHSRRLLLAAHPWRSVPATCPVSNKGIKSVNKSLSRIPGVPSADTHWHTRTANRASSAHAHKHTHTHTHSHTQELISPLTLCPLTRLKWRGARGPLHFNPHYLPLLTSPPRLTHVSFLSSLRLSLSLSVSFHPFYWLSLSSVSCNEI